MIYFSEPAFPAILQKVDVNIFDIIKCQNRWGIHMYGMMCTYMGKQQKTPCSVRIIS